MDSFKLHGGWKGIKNSLKGLITLTVWGVVIIGLGAWIFNYDRDSSISSGSYSNDGYSGNYPYVDDFANDYEPIEPDFEDYKDYIDADSVEACNDSGCYELEADISNGEVETIYFNNGGYRQLNAEFDEDGDGYGYGSDGDEWEIHVDENEIEEAKEEYMDSQANDYDYEDYNYR